MDSYPLALTLNELALLSDHLSMHTPPLPGYETDPLPLILKIGGAFLEAEPAKEVPVSLTKLDLLRIREIAKTPLAFGSERVGLNLVKKAYQALQVLCAEELVRETADTVNLLEPEKGKRDIRDALERIKKGDYDARDGSPDQNDPNHDPGPGNGAGAQI